MDRALAKQEKSNVGFTRLIAKKEGVCEIICGADILDTWELGRNYIAGDKRYIAHFEPAETQNSEIVKEVETILPVETADIDVEDVSSLLEWVQNYEIPISIENISYNQEGRFRKEGRKIFRLIPVEECWERLTEVKIAVQLLKGLGKGEDSVIWDTITRPEGGRIQLVPPLKCTLIQNRKYEYDWQSRPGEENQKKDTHERSFGENPASARYIASCVLIDLIDQGLRLFPTPTQVGFVSTLENPPLMKFAEYPFYTDKSFMAFIWETIKNRFCEKKGVLWPYKKCERCGNKWIEIRPPKYRETRKYCSKCKEEINGESSNETHQRQHWEDLGLGEFSG